MAVMVRVGSWKDGYVDVMSHLLAEPLKVYTMFHYSHILYFRTFVTKVVGEFTSDFH